MKINAFGSIQNAYTIAGAVAVMGENLDRTVIVTDGDRYVSDADKTRQINKAIDGNGGTAEEWRRKALSLITDFSSPEQQPPEKVILDICRSMVDRGDALNWIREDLESIDQQHPVPVGKDAFRQLQLDKDIQMDILETRYLDAICETEEWNEYTQPLRERLNEVVANVGIVLKNNEATANG